jgi:hypothetical protein
VVHFVTGHSEFGLLELGSFRDRGGLDVHPVSYMLVTMSSQNHHHEPNW